MGSLVSRGVGSSRRVIWCDTEGGIRGIPLYDVTFIDEAEGEAPQVVRMFNVSIACKSGRAKIRKHVPMAVYAASAKNGTTYVCKHEYDPSGRIGEGTYSAYGGSLDGVVKRYLEHRRGSVLCAWNMRAHDKKVLTAAVGGDTLDGMVLWDALPWFKKRYSLPKNTLSSDKPGTPRNVLGVLRQGIVHTSLADAAHLREVVLRAAYCLRNGADTKASSGRPVADMFPVAREIISEEVDIEQWIPVSATAWSGEVPASVFKDNATSKE